MRLESVYSKIFEWAWLMILLLFYYIFFDLRKLIEDEFSQNFDQYHWIPEVKNPLCTKYGENR